MAENKLAKVPDSDRISEMWAVVKSLLAGKVDTSTLSEYPKIDAVIAVVTQALSEYPTDEAMRAAIAEALANYMTTTQVNEAIAEAVKNGGLHYELVDELPEVGESNTIYLMENGSGGSNLYDEWYWYNGKFEPIGSTGVDLSNVWKKDELQIMSSEELKEILI